MSDDEKSVHMRLRGLFDSAEDMLAPTEVTAEAPDTRRRLRSVVSGRPFTTLEVSVEDQESIASSHIWVRWSDAGYADLIAASRGLPLLVEATKRQGEVLDASAARAIESTIDGFRRMGIEVKE